MNGELPISEQPPSPTGSGTGPAPAHAPANNAWMEALLRNDGHLVHAARLAALGEIATGIAHEMNQPLAAIQMIVTSMLADLERGKLPLDRARQWLGTINEQIGRISWIIGHMRSFSRNESPEPLAATALGDIVENTLGLLRAQLRSHGISVEVAVEQSLPPVQGDPRRLEQVLVNLLSNARDALDTVPSGAPRRVRIRARAAEGDRIVLEVADNGPGMPPEVRERIFDAFFTTKDVGKGTGLGLSIVRTIIDECGGRIAVESQPGAGTTFRIELPRAHADETQDNQEPSP
jgi:C4-dicarboxylate-specific signal transduction histidine kinase